MHDHDFSALRQLLSRQRRELAVGAEVDRFLVEFHRRQRARLLVRAGPVARAFAWLSERAAVGRPVPSLSYASGLAAFALLICLGLVPQMRVAPAADPYRFALHMPRDEAGAALVPLSFTPTVAQTSSRPETFTFKVAPPEAVRFILGSTRLAYDATVAF